MEDAGGQHRVGAGVDGGREVLGRARAAAGDHGDGDLAAYGADQVEVEAVAGAVGVHGVEQDLAGAELGRPRSAHAIASRPADLRPPWVVTSKPESVPGGPAGVDREHQHLVAEPVGDLGDQLGPVDGGGVDRDLVGAGAQQACRRRRPLDTPAADGERDEDLLGRAADTISSVVARPSWEAEMSRKVSSSAPSASYSAASSTGSPASRSSLEVDALDHPAGVDVEARDDADGEGHGRPRVSVERLLEGEAALVERGADDRALDAVGDQAHQRRGGRRAR